STHSRRRRATAAVFVFSASNSTDATAPCSINPLRVKTSVSHSGVTCSKSVMANENLRGHSYPGKIVECQIVRVKLQRGFHTLEQRQIAHQDARRVRQAEIIQRALNRVRRAPDLNERA